MMPLDDSIEWQSPAEGPRGCRGESVAFAGVSGSAGFSIITVAPREETQDRVDGSAQRWDTTGSQGLQQMPEMDCLPVGSEIRRSSLGGPSGRHQCFTLVSIQDANACITFRKKSRVLSLVSWPLASNRLAAPPIYASGCCIVGTLRKTSDCRRW